MIKKTFESFDRQPDGSYQVSTKFRREFRKSVLIRYRCDAVLKRSYRPNCAGTVSTDCGTVKERPSKRSLQNLVFLLNNCDVPMRSMLTLTMTDKVARNNSVAFHKETRALACQKLRYHRITNYVWVKEFQSNQSPHWHFFTALDLGIDGYQVHESWSQKWKRWMVRRYRTKGWIDDRSAYYMMHGNGAEHVGCCRFEQLGGLEAGGRWWAASKGVKATPIDEVVVNADRIESCKVLIAGDVQDVGYKIQFGRGVDP